MIIKKIKWHYYLKTKTIVICIKYLRWMTFLRLNTPKLLSCENMYYVVFSGNVLVYFFNSGDIVRFMFYEINND